MHGCLLCIAVVIAVRCCDVVEADITQLPGIMKCVTGSYGIELIGYGCFCGIGDHGKIIQTCVFCVFVCPEHNLCSNCVLVRCKQYSSFSCILMCFEYRH